MTDETSRLKKFDDEKADLVNLPYGLIGFEGHTEHTLLTGRTSPHLFILQSMIRPQPAWILLDAFQWFPDYRCTPGSSERALLSLEDNSSCQVFCIVTPRKQGEFTVNLAAPVLYASTSGRAMQIIREGSRFQIRSPLSPCV